MRQRGPRSAASLSVVPTGEPPRPEPPRGLSTEERRIWRELVARFRPDHFIGAEFLLQALVEAVALGHWLTKEIKGAVAANDDKRLAGLVSIQRQQSQVMGNLGRQLRVTPRARLDRYSVRPVPPVVKPWDLGGGGAPAAPEVKGGPFNWSDGDEPKGDPAA